MGNAIKSKAYLNLSFLITLVATSVFAVPAFASPKNGFGAYGGVIAASENGISSKGLSLGADAQFTINEAWSLNPYLMASVERSSSSNTVSDELVGVQLRYWFSEWFIGGHIFEHDRVFFGNGSSQNSSYGPAFGVVAGLESSTGWGALMQTDTFESTSVSGVKRNAFRLSLTYRWY